MPLFVNIVYQSHLECMHVLTIEQKTGACKGLLDFEFNMCMLLLTQGVQAARVVSVCLCVCL